MWFSLATFSCTRINEEKADGWVSPGFGEMKKGGGYWLVKKVLLSKLEVLMKSENYYSRGISISELKVEGVVVGERDLEFKISCCRYL